MLGGGGCQKYFRDLKKNVYVGGGVGWGYAQIFYRLENWGGGMPTNFMNLKNVGGGGYAQIFYRFEKCWVGGGMPTNFMELKNVGGGVYQNILGI